jgi:hypothetical protein
MKIIENRLARAIRCNTWTGYYHRRAANKLRRGSHKNGVTAYPERAQVLISTETMQRLNRLSAATRIERGGILRDAIEMYLSLAETELGEANELPDLAPIVRKPGRKRKPPPLKPEA